MAGAVSDGGRSSQHPRLPHQGSFGFRLIFRLSALPPVNGQCTRAVAALPAWLRSPKEVGERALHLLLYTHKFRQQGMVIVRAGLHGLKAAQELRKLARPASGAPAALFHQFVLHPVKRVGHGVDQGVDVLFRNDEGG